MADSAEAGPTGDDLGEQGGHRLQPHLAVGPGPRARAGPRRHDRLWLPSAAHRIGQAFSGTAKTVAILNFQLGTGEKGTLELQIVYYDARSSLVGESVVQQ